nr:unnamed protein product [Callosobruchus chinensis]
MGSCCPYYLAYTCCSREKGNSTHQRPSLNVPPPAAFSAPACGW